MLGPLGACTHPIGIVGEGDILSASGERDCLLEDQPCESVAVDEYIETYTAVARQGFTFVGWEGCSSGGCHSGSRPTGGMNLSAGNSFANTVGKPALSSALNRIEPGDANNSYLYRKVSAKTKPGSFTISGSPMPFSRPALSAAQLAAWIDAGAPRTGRSSELNEVEILLGACG